MMTATRKPIIARVLTLLLGRLPIGWLQLTHNRTRLIAAVGGVAFANILVFMQLGFFGALLETIRMPYRLLDADIFLTAADANTLTDGSYLPRQRLYEALARPEIEGGHAWYVGKLDWDLAPGQSISLQVFGFDPATRPFRSQELNDQLTALSVPGTALLDMAARTLDSSRFAGASLTSPVSLELAGRQLDLIGGFRIGGGFEADGYLIVSDQTFMRLFPARSPGAPNHILLRKTDGTLAERVAADLRQVLPAEDTRVETLASAVAKDQSYQTTKRPVGVVFGFGVIIGMLVGIIIVYQVLSTDVADHLKEYATFKAMGYPRRFFLGIVFEEAVLLALLGFVPDLLIATGFYAVVSKATGLPLEMNIMRASAVLIGTIAACALSGALATRRLNAADPADLF